MLDRQSSNGSGRAGKYEVRAIETSDCKNDAFKVDNTDNEVTPVATGERTSTDDYKQAWDVTFTPTKANCIKVTYLSSIGGNGAAEQVATLAEFNAYTGVVTSTDEPADEAATGGEEGGEEEELPGDDPLVTTPESPVVTPTVVALNSITDTGCSKEITDGKLKVTTHSQFPQVIKYELDGQTLLGKTDSVLSKIKVNGGDQNVTVSKVTSTRNSVTYSMKIIKMPAISFDVVMTVADGALEYKLTKIVDPYRNFQTVEIPDLDLVTIDGTADASATVLAATIGTNRAQSGDVTTVVKGATNGTKKSWAIVANDSKLAAGFATNAIGDNTSTSRNGGFLDRFSYTVKDVQSHKVATISPASWVHRAAAVKEYTTSDTAGENSIGVDSDPFIKVKITQDANLDSKVDWQDGAIAGRAILTKYVGMNDTWKHVITRIPFNIVSQATHPFLRTLDDTKRIALATDNLGQQVLLKGYQAEGHDSAQGDYGGHYNEKAGGLKDMKTLVDEGKKWNATFGIHVNATESYSEAKAFSENLLRMPPEKAWGWMNQSYYMNNKKDLATAAVLNRLKVLRADFPVTSNMNWLYWDVYYPTGWEAARFAEEVSKQGWRIGSEWAYAMPTVNTWSHWANDENYGGTGNKGLNSKLMRFMENAYRDTWNPDPMLSNPNVIEFEGWSGQNDYNKFILNVWERNLPSKFLQQSDIVSWENNKIKLANGITVESTVNSIDGRTIPTNRTIKLSDDTVVYTDGKYLLPWTDNGTENGTKRLYYWNPTATTSEWTLPTEWRSYSTVKLYQLTDTGRANEQTINVTNKKVTLPAGLINNVKTAFVVYPGSETVTAPTPNWGQSSLISDPGFFSGTLASYTTTGVAKVVTTNRRNFQAQLGAEASSIAQDITVPTAGTYTVWAWVEIEPGKTREVTVSATGAGIVPYGRQTGSAGNVSKTITSSSALNATASDEKKLTYFQRVPLQIKTTAANTKFTFKIAAAAGDANVNIDDLRIVATPEADETLAEGVDSSKVVYYNGFEHQDDGYWPFVTGSTNKGGDARTQLAERHAPYSQSGWWGVVNNKVVDKQKYLDNVLKGTWSLMAHEENHGLILRTTSGSVDLKKNHTYKVTFKYQAAYADDYRFVVGQDTAGAGKWTERLVSATAIKQARGAGWKDVNDVPGKGTQVFTERITVTSDNPTWFGIVKQGNSNQGDMVIDDISVEDLGIIPTVAMDWKPVPSADSEKQLIDITTTVALAEGTATDVKHEVAVPVEWTIKPVKSAETTASADGASVATWRLEVPKGGEVRTITFTGSWKVNGKKDSGKVGATIDPGNLPLINPNGGPEELRVISVTSEQKSGEAAGSGIKEAAIDGDANTYWHTQWSPTNDQFPHEIVLQLKKADLDGAKCEITGFEYQARQNNTNGRAKQFELYVSKDGTEWTKVELSYVAKARYANGFLDTLDRQVMEFAKGYEGSYLKLKELSSMSGNAFGGAGELRIGATCTVPGEEEEDVTPVTPTPVTPTPTPTPAPKPEPKPEPGEGDTDVKPDEGDDEVEPADEPKKDEETQTDEEKKEADEKQEADVVAVPKDKKTKLSATGSSIVAVVLATVLLAGVALVINRTRCKI